MEEMRTHKQAFPVKTEENRKSKKPKDYEVRDPPRGLGRFSGWSPPKRPESDWKEGFCHPALVIFNVAFGSLWPCVSKQCPADGVWRIGRGGSPDQGSQDPV